MKRVIYTFHIALVALCILSNYAIRTQGFNYVVPILGEPTGDDGAHYEQLVSVARFAASQVSSTWSTDTLGVQPFFQSSSPVDVVNTFHNIASNTSVLTTMVPEAQTGLGATLSLLSSSLNLPLISLSEGYTEFNTSSFPYVALHPNQEFVFKAIENFFGFYNFSRIGVLYAPQDYDYFTTFRSHFLRHTHTSIVDIALQDKGRSYWSVMEELIAANLHVIMIISSDSSHFYRVIETAEVAGLAIKGKAWICFNPSDEAEVGYLPPHVVSIKVALSPKTKEREFRTMFHAMDSHLYPGTGSNATLNTHSILAYDAMRMAGATIEKMWTDSVPVNRANFASYLREMTYEGYSGLISFDSAGNREFGALEFMMANASGHPCVFYSYNGTSHAYFAPTWIGDTHEVPKTSSQWLPIAVIAQMDLGLNASLISPTSLAYQYAIERLNNIPGLIPAGYKVVPYLYDHGSSNLLSAQLASNITRIGAVATIGSTVSRLSPLVQTVLGGAGIPQISPSTTEIDLTVKSLYPTFMRACNNAEDEARALIALMEHYNWSRVTILDFESDLAADFVEQALEQGISILNHVIVEMDLEVDMVSVFNTISNSDPHIVVLLGSSESIARISTALYQSALRPKATIVSFSFLFVNITNYASALNIPIDFFSGWLVLSHQTGTGPQYAGFLNEISNLPPSKYLGVPELIQDVPMLQRSFDAALVIANAITRLVQDGGNPRNGAALLSYMLSSNMTGLTGPLIFEETGDRKPFLIVRNVQNGIMQPVGSWSEDQSLVFNSRAIYWPDGTTNVPLDRRARTVTWLKWDSGAGITLAVIATIGLIFGLLVLIAIYWQHESPVITSSTWQFLIVMIIGAMIGFGSVFVQIGYPTTFVCVLRIWMTPLALILIIAPLLTKTWRLHRIFSLRDLKTTPIPLSRLVLLTLICVLIQIIILIFWTSLGTVKVELSPALDDEKLAYAICATNLVNRISTYVTYTYLGILIIICCYLAFKVRKLPKDFNESRWIAVAIYNTLLMVVLLFILGYALRKYKITILILFCSGTIVIGLGALCAMMIPKLWELLRHPERRSSSGSGTYGAGSRQGSSKAKTMTTSAAKESSHNSRTGHIDSPTTGHSPSRTNYSLGTSHSLGAKTHSNSKKEATPTQGTHLDTMESSSNGAYTDSSSTTDE